jgi:hypothetical protein
MSATEASTQILNLLVKSTKCKPSLDEFKMTPLHYAACTGDLEKISVKLLSVSSNFNDSADFQGFGNCSEGYNELLRVVSFSNCGLARKLDLHS